MAEAVSFQGGQGTGHLLCTRADFCICRGYTRKEPFSNAVFSPKAENWNGRTGIPLCCHAAHCCALMCQQIDWSECLRLLQL